MNSDFSLTLLSPTGKKFEGKVKETRFFTADGQVGILPGHCDYMTLLGKGVMDIISVDGSTKQFELKDGFAQVENGTVTVMADSAE